jgi:hypothetical protein
VELTTDHIYLQCVVLRIDTFVFHFNEPHGNEPSGSIKCWEVLEWLHNWRLLKKGSAP